MRRHPKRMKNKRRRKKPSMKRGMAVIAILSGALTALAVLAYGKLGTAWILSAAISFGTVFYHFAMRLAVGHTLNALFHNRFDYTRAWFRPRAFEKRLYATIGVRRWMGRLPTYSPDTFSRALHTWEEIAQATCQAELVHECIALLSFLPLATIPVFGAPWVFVITSVLAAAFDLLFVCIQRYNRPMLLRQIARQQR